MRIIKNPNSPPTLGVLFIPHPTDTVLTPIVIPASLYRIRSTNRFFPGICLRPPIAGIAHIISFAWPLPHMPSPRTLQILDFEFHCCAPSYRPFFILHQPPGSANIFPVIFTLPLMIRVPSRRSDGPQFPSLAAFEEYRLAVSSRSSSSAFGSVCPPL